MDPSLPPITPQDFWEKYRDAFRDACRWKLYRRPPDRTAPAKKAAKRVMSDDFKLGVSREWFRIDLTGWRYPKPKDRKYNWALRIAFEHENAKNWRYELGSLVHIVSDLSVIVWYWDYRKGGLSNLLRFVQRSVSRLKTQIRRVPNRQWLFIVGPAKQRPKEPFVAFTFDPDDPKLQVRQLRDDNPLRPCDWADYQ